MIKASDRSRTGELRRIAAQQLEEEREGERREGKERVKEVERGKRGACLSANIVNIAKYLLEDFC